MPRIVIDLTDLLDFWEGNRAPMGVVRVQISVLEAGLTEDGAPLFELTTFSLSQRCFVAFPGTFLSILIHAARSGSSVEDPYWLELREKKRDICANSLPFYFSAEDRVVALGLTGANPQQLRRLREIRQSYGTIICTLNHDTIPLSVPEHCEPSLSRQFSEHFLAVCLQVDRVITTSNSCAQDFRYWQRRFLPVIDIPIHSMPLNARFLPLLDSGFAKFPDEIPEDLQYVLCVSTIESRKNHLLLLHAWITLTRRHGLEGLPYLVLVGRPGFLADQVLQLIALSPELRRCVIRLEDVDDKQLVLLYQNSMFTVFNSFYEGWGLPVTEALSYGKLVVAPDHTGVREAGGAAAQFFTAQNEAELTDLLWELIQDPIRRQRLEAAISDRVTLRSWREVASGLVRSLMEPAPALPAPLQRLYFPMGIRIGFERPEIPDLPDLPQPFTLLHQLLCEGEGWGEQERWGVWATSGPARLRLPMPAPPNGEMVLAVEVTTPPGRPTSTGFRVIRPGKPPERWMNCTLPAGRSSHLSLIVPQCNPGDVLVEIDTTEATIPPGEDRHLTIMITGLMICARSDEESQLEYFSGRLGIAECMLSEV